MDVGNCVHMVVGKIILPSMILYDAFITVNIGAQLPNEADWWLIRTVRKKKITDNYRCFCSNPVFLTMLTLV